MGSGHREDRRTLLPAGHPEPEFGEQAGTLWLRFPLSNYLAPHRVVLDLYKRQREILQVLGNGGNLALREVMARLDSPPASATVRDDLYHLKRIGLD